VGQDRLASASRIAPFVGHASAGDVAAGLAGNWFSGRLIWGLELHA
jgi:hypothetical protein